MPSCQGEFARVESYQGKTNARVESYQGGKLSGAIYPGANIIGWVRLGDQGPEGPLCRGAAPIPRAGLGDARRASPKSGRPVWAC